MSSFFAKTISINLRRLSFVLICSALFVVFLGLVVEAKYVEGNLIDDSMFIDSASMGSDPSQIQAFLAGRGGYLAGYYSYSERDGRDVSAAQIIFEAAQDYNINPKVILATLQKEQSLVTAVNPLPSQINFAMGYGCFTGTNCSSYPGFYKQVTEGSWQLRLNYARASGDNSWGGSGYSYACNSAKPLYSAALRPGNHVTFYDEAGAAYKSFVINNAATASLYCYTPHVYPGTSAYYYSGNYSFVTAFEQWFGSTQPMLVVSSPLRVSGEFNGKYTGVPITVSFDITNNTDSARSIDVASTVRGPGGINRDHPLKTITVGAHSTSTYSSSSTFSIEGEYRFGITSLVGGQWNDDYPVSSWIDNARSTTINSQAMPTITLGPTMNVSNARIGQTVSAGFVVKNNSASSINLGYFALSLRDPDNKNVDLGLADAASIGPGEEFVYGQSFTPKKQGIYSAQIVQTGTEGRWITDILPATLSGVARSAKFVVGPSPTIVAGIQSSVVSPHVGQATVLTYKVKNYGSNSVNLGFIGLGARDPLWNNVDPGIAQVTLAAGEERVMSYNFNFSKTGTYRFSIISTNDFAGWGSGPTAESSLINKTLEVSVGQNPTLTQGPILGSDNVHVGQQVDLSFKVKNYSNMPVEAGYLGLAVRDPFGKNVDAGAVDLVLGSGEEYVFSVNKAFVTPGTYTAWVASYRNGIWDNETFPSSDSISVKRLIRFVVKPNPTTTLGVGASNSSPHVGQSIVVSYKIKNFGSAGVDLGYIGLGARDPSGKNIDPGIAQVSLAAGVEKTVSYNITLSKLGTYRFFILSTSNFINWSDGPPKEDDSIQKVLEVHALP